MTARAFAGEPVEYALRDPRSGRVLASVTSPFYGPKLFYADDPAGEWEQAEGVALPEGGDAALERIWVIVPGEADGRGLRGRRPGRAVREPRRRRDVQLEPRPVGAPARPTWQPGGGGLCLHSIVPGRASRTGSRSAISAGGRVADRRRRRQRGAAATRASSRATCPTTRPPDEVALCVHRLHRAPTRPERMFMQFHGGVYRSDDAGETWTDIGAGPAVGLRLPAGDRPRRPRQRVRDPADAPTSTASRPTAACASTRRATPARAGRRAATACPHEHAYLTILREAFDWAGEGDALELYFGATSGEVFGSGDAGASWFDVATHLPPVLSVAVPHVISPQRDLDPDRRAAARRRVAPRAPRRAHRRGRAARAGRVPATDPHRRRRRRRPGGRGSRPRRRDARTPRPPARTWRRWSAPRR